MFALSEIFVTMILIFPLMLHYMYSIIIRILKTKPIFNAISLF